jgi:hypothetical protein
VVSRHLICQNNDGFSTLNLSRHLGVSYNTAWSLLKHKLMQVMLERQRQSPLASRIEMDDARIGSMESTEDGKPVRMKMHKVEGFRKGIVKQWSQQQIKAGSQVVTDGLGAFNGLDKAGIDHEGIIPMAAKER